MRASPHALGQRLDECDGDRQRPVVQQPLHPAVPPQRARAVAEDERELPSGGVAQPGRGPGPSAPCPLGAREEGAVRSFAYVLGVHLCEGPGDGADLGQLVERLLPQHGGAGEVHHQLEAHGTPFGRAQHGQHQPGLRRTLGRRLLVQSPGGAPAGRLKALKGAERPLERQRTGQRGGGGNAYRHGPPGPVRAARGPVGRPGRRPPGMKTGGIRCAGFLLGGSAASGGIIGGIRQSCGGLAGCGHRLVRAGSAGGIAVRRVRRLCRGDVTGQPQGIRQLPRGDAPVRAARPRDPGRARARARPRPRSLRRAAQPFGQLGERAEGTGRLAGPGRRGWRGRRPGHQRGPRSPESRGRMSRWESLSRSMSRPVAACWVR